MKLTNTFLPAACLFVAAPFLYAFTSGAPERVSGAPGERNCTSCHAGSPNSGPGKVRIEMVGADNYTPGQTTRMRVVIEDDSARKWGFELSARPENNPDGNAGSFKELDGTTQVLMEGISQWITHTSAGARLNTRGPIAFEFNYTAPASDVGPIVFYASANAANGNSSPSGDSIYTAALTVSPAAVGVPRPSFRPDGVSDLYTGLPGMAPGAWVTLTGTDLASGRAYWAPAAGKPLDTVLGKVTVKINDVPAPLLYVGPDRIQLLVPAATPEGDVPVVVESDGRVSETVFVQNRAVLPAFVTVPAINSDAPRLYATATTAGAGTALALISNKGLILGRPDVDPRAVRGALPGEEIDLYAIGLGKTDEGFATDSISVGSSPLSNTPSVLLGEVTLTPTYTALVAPGLYVVRVKVPDSAPGGDTPIVLQVNGISSQANVLVYVQQ
ncbi:MAG: hypothetical protein HY820_29640 [Acidobacteria bacterium]|nr:hypothetical protein [Acidobacteriota bacterium]